MKDAVNQSVYGLWSNNPTLNKKYEDLTMTVCVSMQMKLSFTNRSQQEASSISKKVVF